ncbi:hypothetical protein QBC32DRAFT_351240 [Pseudoneurospora amorphoporcata]|uniref:Uncharacterized protein n=1 Tax=Pseudoneurospora amorphoporcata TaxID=241081 RepID=A0AAN6SCI4_9PEZI|nr:hypothetical protein QBC32DRAFT_351240 [Pseudoneurospora amorphoporcata]
MQDAGEASTWPPNNTWVATSGKRYPVPSVISAIEKEIVAAGVARLDMFERLHPKFVLLIGPTAMERAQEIMNKEAQKSHESRKIWNDIFKQGKNVTNRNLFEHDIFSQDAWKKLYELVMENGMYPPEVLGETDEETRQTLELWEEAQNKRCEEYRKESEEMQAEWQRRVDAGADPILQIIGLPPLDGEDDIEEGA